MKNLYQNNFDLFGNNLSHYRRLCGMTQEALGRAVGMNRTYISALEHGRANPTLKLMSTLAIALKVDVGNLLTIPNDYPISEEELK